MDDFDASLRDQLDGFIDQHRAMLLASLDGLTNEEARRSLVPSRTTLLGPDILREQILAARQH